MVKINIVGDFYSPFIGSLELSRKVSAILKESDLNVVNLEGAISCNNMKPIKKSGPNISQDPNVSTFLKKCGFDVFSLANNHIMDFGKMAFDSTLTALKDKTIVGAGNWDEAYKVKICQIHGIKIGFLALTQYEFGTLSEKSYSKQMLGSAWIGHPCVDEIINEAKTQCEFLIVLPHAGLEYFTLPLPEIRTLYRHFIDMGADAVIASHPHVPQPCEIYNNKPIAYSLGNFCFDEECNKPFWYVGLLVQLNLHEDGISMHVETLHFDRDKRQIEILKDKETEMKLFENQKKIQIEEEYLNAVNNYCLSLETFYDMLFEMSGYSRLSIKRCLGYIKRKLFCKISMVNDAHYINCIRCETHKWVLSRIYELKNHR